MEEEFYSNFLGSSSANVLFVMIFFVGAWLKTRLNKSRCASRCACFECETSLRELEQKLEHTQTLQKNMLHDIIVQLKKGQEGMGSLDSTPRDGPEIV